MAQNFQHFPDTQVHIPWAALRRMFIRQPNVPLERPCSGASMVRSLFFFLLVVFLSWKNTFSLFAFVWEVHFPGDNSDLGFWEPSVFRGEKLSTRYCFFFEKMSELWAKNRILEADLFAFDRFTHWYDFKLVGGKRFVWSIRSVFFFCDTHRNCRMYAVSCILLPATSCTR